MCLLRENKLTFISAVVPKNIPTVPLMLTPKMIKHSEYAYHRSSYPDLPQMRVLQEYVANNRRSFKILSKDKILIRQ